MGVSVCAILKAVNFFIFAEAKGPARSPLSVLCVVHCSPAREWPNQHVASDDTAPNA
jgi:hypothetical protein